MTNNNPKTLHGQIMQLLDHRDKEKTITMILSIINFIAVMSVTTLFVIKLIK